MTIKAFGDTVIYNLKELKDELDYVFHRVYYPYGLFNKRSRPFPRRKWDEDSLSITDRKRLASGLRKLSKRIMKRY